MPYFADLTTYRYAGPAVPWALNVGWLSIDHPFETGSVDGDVLERLQHGLRFRGEHFQYGFHTCEWCGAATGVGEIWYGLDDVLYAAPVLIGHYIEAHAYRPPSAYLAAVRHGVMESQPPKYPEVVAFDVDAAHDRVTITYDDGRTHAVRVADVPELAGAPTSVTVRDGYVRVRRTGTPPLEVVDHPRLLRAAGLPLVVQHAPVPPEGALPPLPRP